MNLKYRFFKMKMLPKRILNTDFINKILKKKLKILPELIDITDFLHTKILEI